MYIFGTWVARNTDDVGNVAILVGNIIDRQSLPWRLVSTFLTVRSRGKKTYILIVAVADVTSVVTLVRSSVHQALGIVHIAITSSATGREWVRRIGHVQENKTATTGQVTADTNCLVTADRSYSHCVVEFLVNNDVVRAADGELVPVASEISLGEIVGVGRVESEKLLHVKDLHARVDGL